MLLHLIFNSVFLSSFSLVLKELVLLILDNLWDSKIFRKRYSYLKSSWAFGSIRKKHCCWVGKKVRKGNRNTFFHLLNHLFNVSMKLKFFFNKNLQTSRQIKCGNATKGRQLFNCITLGVLELYIKSIILRQT